MNRKIRFWKLLIALIGLNILMTRCESKELSVDDIIENHYKVLGSIEILDMNTYNIQGVIDLNSSELKFEATQSKNQYYYFKQFKVEDGIDFSPPMMKKLNKNGAFFIIDDSEMGNGMNISSLPEEANFNWRAFNTIELSPLYYLKKNGANIHFDVSDDRKDKSEYKLLARSGSNEIRIYINGETFLINRLKFNSYHPQLGLVEIEREFIEYSEYKSLKFPSKWTDKRGETILTYQINSIVFTDQVDYNLFETGENSTKDEILSSKDIKKVILEYIEALNNQSPFENSNSKVEKGLIKYLNGARYESLSAKQLSQKLSDDIIDLTADYHFGVDYNPKLFKALSSEVNSDLNEDELLKSDAINNHFYIHSTKRLEDDFFYFKIDQMARINYARDLVDSLMMVASKSKGLIIDLRNNTGGADSFNRYLLSYFIPENTLLFERIMKDSSMNIYTRKTLHQLSSLKTLPLYVIVNENTVSAGEQLAYILQNHDRAKIVGKTTFGAAHGSIDVPLSNNLIGLVPIGYEKHIKTKRDWEGAGVKPDIVSESDDLTELLQLIKNDIK